MLPVVSICFCLFLDSFNQSDLLPLRSSRSVPKAAARSEHCACLREASLFLNVIFGNKRKQKETFQNF